MTHQNQTTAPATDELIAEIEAGLDGVTPGPWLVGYHALHILSHNQKYGEVRLFDVRGWGYLTGFLKLGAAHPHNLPLGSWHVAYQTEPAPPLIQTWRYANGPDRGQQIGWPTHWMHLPQPPSGKESER